MTWHIRVLGLCVGLSFLASLWLCSRWMGGRAPILSVALLGSLPAFVFIVGANRAYGLASCLLVLSFGMIWRMVESPVEVAGSLGRSRLPSVHAVRLFRRDFSVRDAGRRSHGDDSTATVENVVDAGGDWASCPARPW